MPRGVANGEAMELTLSQKDGDRLAAIKAVDARQITQLQAAEELAISKRQVRRLLRRYVFGGSLRGWAWVAGHGNGASSPGPLSLGTAQDAVSGGRGGEHNR